MNRFVFRSLRASSPEVEKRDLLASRIWEIDLLRGAALFLMLLQHFAFDLSLIWGWPFLDFIQKTWFLDALRPCVLVWFLLASGLSCRFSRSHLRHGTRVALAALLMSAATILFEAYFHLGFPIYFNVLHVLALAILMRGSLIVLLNKWLSSFLSRLHARFSLPWSHILADLLSLLGLLLLYAIVLALFSKDTSPILALLFFLPGVPLPEMGDHLAFLPWALFFYLGALMGDLFYIEKKSVFGGEDSRLWRAPLSCLTWLGRYPLWVYLLHQPIFFALLTLIHWLVA